MYVPCDKMTYLIQRYLRLYLVLGILLFQYSECSSELIQLNHKAGCPLEPDLEIHQCTVNSSEVRTNRVIPFGTSCLLIKGFDEFNITCISNHTEGNIKLRNSDELHRERRQSDDLDATKLGAVIGSPFGPVGAAVGAAVGFIGDIICIFACEKSNPPPPNYPPRLTTRAKLSQDSPIKAKKGQNKASVSWSMPVFHDKEDNANPSVTSSPDYLQSGHEFEEGRYTVFFSAVDSKGLPAQTQLFFEVKVVRCSSLSYPNNGEIRCTAGAIYGSKCTVTCDKGYTLAQTSTECKEDGSWSHTRSLDCKPISCKEKPSIQHGYVQCLGGSAVFGSVCQVVCERGFSAQGMSLMSCGEDGEWRNTPTCADTQPPYFQVGECPNNMQVTIDSADNTALLQWDVPNGADNSNETVTIAEIHGYSPGQRFEAGLHTIKYRISDAAGNYGDSCMFVVQIQSVSCHPPDLTTIGKDNMAYDCPNLYTIGAECNLRCRGGYPLGGADKIRCGFDKNKNIAWSWDETALQPFCKETNCTALSKPENGAITCARWTHGQTCTMQCNDKYDVPASVTNNGQFVCGLSTGQWRPNRVVPDCNVKFNPRDMHLPSEFYYYTNNCNSSKANLNQIQENFVKALNSSNFPEFCVGNEFCQARYVDIACGPVSYRRKRDTHIYERSTKFAYIVNFDFVLPMEVSSVDAFIATEEKLNKMADAFGIDVNKGHFSIPGLQVESDSFAAGNAEYKCAVGMKARASTSSCVGCPVGQFMINDTLECVKCDYGTYQPNENSASCLPCPPLTHTTSTGSINASNCKSFCNAGEYSPTGLAPCAKCPSDAYQPETGSTSCIKCPTRTRSITDGATDLSDCLPFDIRISNGSPIETKTTKPATTISLTFWVMLRDTTTDGSKFALLDSLQSEVFSLHMKPYIEGQVSGKAFCTTTHSIDSLVWTHVTMLVDSSEMTIYLNGKQICHQMSPSLLHNTVVHANGSMYFNGDIQLSNLHVVKYKATNAEITMWATSCSFNVSSAIIDLDALSSSTNAHLVTPSMCDATAECKSSPCGMHNCVDKGTDFQCVCSDGYTGKQCEIPPIFCATHECQNGATCTNEKSNYACVCPFGYSGNLCQRKAVDGMWSSWLDWSQCSKTCGGGVTSRTRLCNSPSPDQEGLQCVGTDTESSPCNQDKCPECSRLHRSLGVMISCNDTDEIKQCRISCRPGLYFATPAQPSYECGVSTGYKWNHQNENNPTGRLPSCSEIKPPSEITLSFDGHFNTLPCTVKNTEDVKAAMQPKLGQLGCVKEGQCEVELLAKDCVTSRNNVSISSGVIITLQMKSGIQTQSNLNVEAVLGNNSAPSAALLELVKKTLELERTAQTIANNSIAFFQVTVGGSPHSIPSGPGGLTPYSSVQCSPGSVRLEVFCAECPVGSYSNGRTITMCPVGMYQDRKGQSSCNRCPSGTSTPGIGSTDALECSVTVSDERKGSGSHDTSNAVTIGVGVTVSILLLVVAVIALVFAMKHFKKKKDLIDSTFDLHESMYTIPAKPVFRKEAL